MPHVHLYQLLPKAGFAFPHRSQVTSRDNYDILITAAIKKKTGSYLNRPNVVPILVCLFETAATTCLAHVPGPNDDNHTALLGAITTCQRGTPWAHKLPASAFIELLLYTRAARRMYRTITGFEDTDPGTWARTLGIAVDKFDDAVLQRGWGHTEEVLTLEADEDDATEDAGSMPSAAEQEVGAGADAMDLDTDDGETGEKEKEDGVIVAEMLAMKLC
ncbi:hypothetical protein CONLIGDRAFT_685454 [Coniochaeta ligniaria NRRL 30616]|uniref:Uncharacterized protein n=1 Tax=Coniochaeta ligniaria NRRL 30616 TaxID=1408157 RepID=A0A1J7JA94_9PEZI|nr:hypothetical protein CONLIGDRAFT_685454 [Coniochaeta ligniaria NRRL 30616]